MAANYWNSTQRQHWSFSRERLAVLRQALDDRDSHAVTQYPLPDLRLIFIYLYSQLQRLTRKLHPSHTTPRQLPLATALTYLRRFYLYVPFRHTNPHLTLTTAFYLSSKLEETPHHIRLILSEARSLFPETLPPEVAKIGECEFSIISELNSHLIVHHPYKTLEVLKQALQLSQEEYNLAWSVINDSYLTDLPLLVAPHIIAITAIVLAVVLAPSRSTSLLNAQQSSQSNSAPQNQSQQLSLPAQPPVRPGSALVSTMKAPLSPAHLLQNEKVQRIVDFMAESEIDIEAVIESTQEIISLYELWESSYNEKLVREAILRFVKGRGLDK